MQSSHLNGFISCLFMLLGLQTIGQTHNQNKKVLKQMQKVTGSAVLLNNQQHLIPLEGLQRRSVASVQLDFTNQSVFDSLLNFYGQITELAADKYSDSLDLNDLEDDLKFFNTVVVSVTAEGLRANRFLHFIQDIAGHKDLVLVVFGEDKDGLQRLQGLRCPILWTPYQDQVAANIVAQMVFGGIAMRGKLPFSFGSSYPKGAGLETTAVRLKYTLPEDLGINISSLKGITSIASEAVAKKATPGMVVLAAKDGKVFYLKSFGHHTYDGVQPESVTDIFDLASVTKITATTPSVMRLVEEGRLSLDSTIGHYIAKARNAPMRDIAVREVMLHQAGFVPFIPFPKLIQPQDFRLDSSAAYPTKVADHYFIRADYFNDFMWPTMLYSPIVTRGKYVYSDISMYVMQDIVELLTDTTLDQYAHNNFYKPLGMHSTGYLPRYKFPLQRIVPTENDTSFRKSLLVGYVHDEGASLKGGVAGHAGLFSSAPDMAAYYQMLLNKGIYGGYRYFAPQTVVTFTKNESKVSRRGYGFDRKDPDPKKEYPSRLASMNTFGHTGYTGTCVWVDEDRHLVYIFLSNRVNPTRSPMLGELNIRSRIQDVLNKAIDEVKK